MPLAPLQSAFSIRGDMLCPCRVPRFFHRGFTTIELMVVLAVLAILAALAAPSLGPTLERWRVRQAVEDMTSTYSFGRSEAIRQGGNITVRKNDLVAAQCPQASGAGDWSCGWIVFDDANGNGTQDSGERTLRTTPAFSGISVKNADTSGQYFQFTRWGELQGAVALGFAFTPARTGSGTSTALCMAPGGRVRAKPGATSCS